ncbi:MAG TPA: hypothetical protein VMX33_11935, partial [bacterium]|nr:hypothetical protein [bacterium]
VHAEVAGIDRGSIRAQLARLYTDRPFISQHKPNDEAARIWLKRAATPLKEKPDRLPTYAGTGWMQGSTN